MNKGLQWLRLAMLAPREKWAPVLQTSGPGATNLVIGLGDAMMDSIPVVTITGQVASPLIGTDAFQEADVLGLSFACTKHSFIVQSADVALQGFNPSA